MLNYVHTSEQPYLVLRWASCEAGHKLRVSSLVPVNTLQIFNLLLAAPQHTAYI